MELIERYLQEIGRYLPANKRTDILSELRSALDDSLESRGEGQPSEEDVVKVIKEMGAPRKVAASYYPEGQYLIGPELFPFFQFILGIVFAVSIGGQLIAAVISFAVSPHQPYSIVHQFLQILVSIPATLGTIVFPFAILQWFDVHPDFEKKDFDPHALPPLHKDRPIKRTERVLNIIFGTIFLAFLSGIAASGGFSGKGNVVKVFTNPVLDRYFPWIAIAIVIGILLDIVLLWRGRWEISTRAAKIGINIFGMVVLFLLIQGHAAWLGRMGINGFMIDPSKFTNTPQGLQSITMFSFYIAFLVAFIVSAVETLVSIYRLLRPVMSDGTGIASTIR